MVSSAFYDFVAILVAIAVIAVVLLGVFFIAYLVVDGITTIWKETVAVDTFDVVVIDKTMTQNVSTRYSVLVKGTDLNGEEYCKTLNISASAYANVSVGDMLQINQTITEKPLFGEHSVYKLVEPVLATN